MVWIITLGPQVVYAQGAFLFTRVPSAKSWDWKWPRFDTIFTAVLRTSVNRMQTNVRNICMCTDNARSTIFIYKWVQTNDPLKNAYDYTYHIINHVLNLTVGSALADEIFEDKSLEGIISILNGSDHQYVSSILKVHTSLPMLRRSEWTIQTIKCVPAHI